MWICSQTKLIALVSSVRSLHHFLNWFIGFCQLATLKLVEQGKITFDTPVADYLPQLRNPIIVDRTDTQKTSFKPAQTVVTVKHLLNFTSGLFYPTEPDANMTKGWSSKEMHLSEDPTSEFFRIVIVRFFFFRHFLAGIRIKHSVRESFPLYRWNLNPEQTVSCSRSSRPMIKINVFWWILVVYGWSAEVAGFLVEKVSGQTLEQFWYVIYFASFHTICWSSIMVDHKQQGAYFWSFGHENNFFLDARSQRKSS